MSGCATARHRAQGNVVRNIDFDGNGNFFSRPLSGQSNYQLRQELSVSQSPLGALTIPLTYLFDLDSFDPEDLREDAYQLEIWYAHHGWFDAQVTGWELRTIRPETPRKARVVDITGYLSPGERSTMRDISVTGLTGGAEILGRVAMRTSPVQPRVPFDLDQVFTTRDTLLQTLRDQSYAYSTVQAKIDSYPEDHAVDVTYEATSGPVCKLGAITVTGNEHVETKIILDELDIKEGDPYSAKELRAAQRRLFALGVFGVVNVLPDLSDPSNTNVPITVAISEAKPNTIRFGGGFDYDGQVFAPKISSRYQTVNLFDQLIRVEIRGDLGYAADLTQNRGTRQLVASTELNVSTPRAFGSRDLGVLFSAGVRRDLQNGQFPYINPKVGLSLTWQPQDNIIVTVGPRLQQFEYLDFTGQTKLVANSVFGENFKNPYRLTTADANVVLDWRDDPLNPEKGRYAAIGVRQAVPFTETDFFYTEVNFDGRLYAQINNVDLGKTRANGETPGKSLTIVRGIARALQPEGIAGRFKSVALQSWGEGGLPYPERAFLGGATELRGFKTDQVGAYDCLCLYDRDDGGDAFSGEPGAGQTSDPYYLPKGGSFSAMASLEARFDAFSGIGAVVFADLGVLGDKIVDLRPSNLRTGAGVGIRYGSPLGPLRADLAFRPLYPEDWGPDRYINCQSDDQIPRSFDLFSLPKGSRDLSERFVPFAMNFFVGIGQAI